MISVLYNIILITNFKLIEMCIKSSRKEKECLTDRASAECVFRRCAHRIYVLADTYLLTARYVLRSC